MIVDIKSIGNAYMLDHTAGQIKVVFFTIPEDYFQDKISHDINFSEVWRMVKSRLFIVVLLLINELQAEELWQWVIGHIQDFLLPPEA